MFDDEDWTTIALIAGLVWLGAKAVSAVKTIKREVERFDNFGLATDEDRKARDTLADPKATIAERRAASATLRKKVDGAKAAGYASQVKALEQALDTLDRELAGQDELEEKRREWEAARAAAAKS
jgi:flagellar biosynthesis chaperone FliJ